MPFAWTCALAGGADWLSKRGDPQQTGWQGEEKLLNARTIKQLRLLWKRKLNNGPDGLTDPLLLGPIITHQGIKELVFVKNSSDTVYAVDADPGTTFWSRHLGEDMPNAPCAESFRVAPVMASAPQKTGNLQWKMTTTSLTRVGRFMPYPPRAACTLFAPAPVQIFHRRFNFCFPAPSQ